MGILKQKVELEDMFEKLELTWKPMSDSEYRTVVSNWRNAFEAVLIENIKLKESDDAIYKLEEKFPFTGYIFNLPNYKYLPVTPSSYDPSYGYVVENISEIDREALNRSEAIICDAGFNFTCAFNHEGQSGIPEIYVESNA
jgi:hypothetical protein